MGEFTDGLVGLRSEGTRLCAVCAGVFVLAETQLLDCRDATTHWAFAEELARRYPAQRWGGRPCRVCRPCSWMRSLLLERLSQRVDGQLACDIGGRGVPQSVQQHEVVDGPADADGRHLDAGLTELVGVQLAPVPQDVGLRRDDEGGRQPLKVLKGRPQRRGVLLLALGFVGRVRVPEPLHPIAGEIVVLRELVVGLRVEVRPGHGVEQDLRLEREPAAVLVHLREDRGHASADRLAGDGDAGGVEAMVGAVVPQPLTDGVILLDLRGVPLLGRPVVDREDAGGPGSDGELPEEAVVGLVVAEDPPGTVDVEDHGQRARGALGLDDAGAYGAPLAGVDVDPLLVDVRALDAFAALQVAEDLAPLFGRNLVDPRVRVGGVGELLGLRFQVRGGGGWKVGHR
nr:AraC family transcriptional regulator [Streptomyces tsukubensis NRRL18488]